MNVSESQLNIPTTSQELDENLITPRQSLFVFTKLHIGILISLGLTGVYVWYCVTI